MKLACVTGSKGFVGRHMAVALYDAGYEVVGIDSRGGRDCRDFFQHVDTRFDLLVHCAAVVGGRTFIDGQPLKLACEDLSIDAALFDFALRTKPQRLVYFSSSAAYPVLYQGERGWHRLVEGDIHQDYPQVPDSTYGWVKLTGERLAALVDVPCHVFRPFSGYGSDQALDYPFPRFIQRARERHDPFEIWGPLHSTRDWVHIDDIVGAVMAAIDQDVRGPVNICTGRATSFDKLARLVSYAAGYLPELVSVHDAPTGVIHRVGDPTLMNTFYTPRVSLEEGILRALKGDE